MPSDEGKPKKEDIQIHGTLTSRHLPLDRDSRIGDTASDPSGIGDATSSSFKLSSSWLRMLLLSLPGDVIHGIRRMQSKRLRLPAFRVSLNPPSTL